MKAEDRVVIKEGIGSEVTEGMNTNNKNDQLYKER